MSVPSPVEDLLADAEGEIAVRRTGPAHDSAGRLVLAGHMGSVHAADREDLERAVRERWGGGHYALRAAGPRGAPLVGELELAGEPLPASELPARPRASGRCWSPIRPCTCPPDRVDVPHPHPGGAP